MEENRNKENRNVENRNEENRNEEKKAAGQNIQTIEEKTEDASSGDIRDSQPSKRSYKRRRESIIHKIIPLVLFISMLVFGGLFLRDFLEYKAADDEYAALEEHIVVQPERVEQKEEKKKEEGSAEEKESEPETEAPEPVDIAHPKFQINYDTLAKINGDFTAVIYVPAIGISYPVVRSKDNEDYLHRTFEGKANFAGSIFLDANAKGSYDNKNTFIFGHNMKNGSMFGKLKNFLKDPSLADSNPYVFLCKPDGIYRYRIYSYYLTTTESDIYADFEGDSGYDRYVQLTSKLSSYRNYPKGAIDFSTRPNLITLSTCSGPSGGNQRFIVQAAFEELYPNS